MKLQPQKTLSLVSSEASFATALYVFFDVILSELLLRLV